MLSFVLLASLVVAASGDTCSYSSICSDHTMCKYPAGPAATCTAPVYSGITSAADKKAIVNRHNELRSGVAKGQETRGNPGPQPAAANMRNITWDDELATVAQRWSDQCTFGHDSCRSVGRFYVGQNVYISYTTASPDNSQDWKAAVQAWYDEVKDFNKNNVDPFQFTSGTGHYTQVVWADTYKVGCGFTAFRGSNGWYSKLYVCNYGPGGNIIGGTMYKKGTACSQCSSTCDNGLCV